MSARDHAHSTCRGDAFGATEGGEGSALRWEDAPAGVTLWGVYGPDCFPTVFACQMKDYFWHGRAIWGFSVYEGEPGFRTLGQGLAWAEKHNLRLFATPAAAFDHIATLFQNAAPPEVAGRHAAASGQAPGAPQPLPKGPDQ